MVAIRNALLVPITLLAFCSIARAETINEKVVSFLKPRVGTRVGGGECAHAASEALRVSGGAFEESDLGADNPAAGDYVWGTLLKVIAYEDEKVTDSQPEAKVLPGDILQYHDTRFVSVTQEGNVTRTRTSVAAHHTSIVSKVDTAGVLPTEVYEQNAPSPTNVQTRAVQTSAIDFANLRSGWVRIYRPQARSDSDGKYQITIVNNTPQKQKVAIHFEGSAVFDVSLTASNTANSYALPSMNSTAADKKFSFVLENGASAEINNARGYEVYTASNGATAIRQLSN